MKRHVVFVVFSLAAAPACATADNPHDAPEILNKAISVADKLTAIAYDAKVHGEGALADKYPTFTGHVVAIRGATDQRHKFAVKGTMTMPGFGTMSSFSFATDGVNTYQIDEGTKTFIQGKPEELGMSIGNPLFPPTYLTSSAFKEAMKSPSLRYDGMRTMDGIQCNVVSAMLQGTGNQVSRFYFGKDDFLLRRMENVLSASTRPGGPVATGTIVFAASGLDPNPKIDNDAFRLECPKGFEKKPLTLPQRPGQPDLLPVGSEAPDWELKTADGQTVTLKGLRGKVVVLDFWATWCAPCRMAMPRVQKLHERFKGKPVAVYGINCLEPPGGADPMAYVKSQGYTYGQLLNGNAVASAYRVSGLPCFYIIGPDGKILHTEPGLGPWMEEIATGVIEKALKP